MATKDPRDEQPDASPFPTVRPATPEEVARLEQAHRAWERPEVRHWLETGKWPDEGADAGEGAGEDEGE